jgi:hypothetical protein
VARLREARTAYSILAGKDPNRDEKIILIEVFREIGSKSWCRIKQVRTMPNGKIIYIYDDGHMVSFTWFSQC